MITTKKRDLQKKREQKKMDKQKRKEIRRSNASGTFEDMIAYVDACGNLTDIPQTPGIVQEIELEDIAISTPRKTDAPTLPQMGYVEHFNENKGYGFIKDSRNGNQYFFHISHAPACITQGHQVTFEVKRGPRGLIAVHIEMATNKSNK
ncbi:MAG: cold shock domain-containing protein [Paraprevotella sp.]|nr:cold shock domain-containing protein [Paraprevotella sp.]